jgi:2Fe-2S ferredoxin
VPTVHYVLQDGTSRSVQVPEGTSVMRGAIDNGLPGIDAECGGCLSCATCHVYVDEKFLGLLEPASKDEQEMLDFVAAERRAGSRLSCQIPVTAKLEGLTVRMPDRQSDL